MDISLLIHPRHNRLQERLQFGIGVAVCAVKAKLRDPDWPASGDGSGRVDVFLKIGCAGVLVRVPVQVDKVDLAASALVEELLQVGEAVGTACVGDCWGSELSLASERLHVVFKGRND